MKLIDYYPNVERIITTIDSRMITNKEYNKLIKLSRNIKKELEHILDSNINKISLIKYYVEKIITNSKYSENYTNVHKEIIIANILLPDDIKIAEVLNQNGYPIEYLKAIIKFRDYLKKIILYSIPIDKEIEQKYIAKLEK